MTSASKVKLSTILARSLQLKCAICGQGKLFRNWFRMHARCEHCQAKFEPEPGFYLGSIYVNYGITAVTVVTAYLTLFLTYKVSPATLLWSLSAFCLIFPLWFFRYARSIWFGFDHYWDPTQRRDS